LDVVLARLLLIVALLAGWQAALVHPIEHVDELGALVHVGENDGEHGSSSGELCDVLAALSACAASSSSFIAIAPPAAAVAAAPRFEPRRAQAPPFLSQGPPAVL
jgi:hypothetical protein